MKYFLFKCLLFSAFLTQGQAVHVEYEIAVQLDGKSPFTNRTTLTANNQSSLFTIYVNKKVTDSMNSKIVESTNDEGVAVFSIFNFVETSDTGIILINRDNDTIKQAHQHRGEFIVINDTSAQLDWEILSDTKRINSFNCVKAKAHFRGRDFIAWFTPDIPISAGPAKFHGLPGLILSVHDVDMIWQWNATLVKYPILLENEERFFSIDLSKYHPYSLKDYVEKQSKEVLENQKKFISKLPKGSKTLEQKRSRNGLELIYEWELTEVKD